MNTTENYLVLYADVSLNLSIPAGLVPHVRAELEPFFTFAAQQRSSGRPFATLRVHQLAPAPEMLPTGDAASVTIDTSLYAHLASKGRRWGDESRYAIYIEVTQTWAFFDKPAATVDLYQAESKPCLIDTVRTIKGLFTPTLELSGGIQLHGSAVTGRHGCVLILADMWHGKTTLLLEMLAQFKVAQLSCDTVVLCNGPGGGALISGWPSPFSVSHGTMADFPELYSSFPPNRATARYDQLWQERKKAVLSSSDVVKRFDTVLTPQASRVDVCFLARFAPHEASAIERVDNLQILINSLQTVCLGSRDPIYHNWHQFMVCPSDILDASISWWAGRLLETTEVYSMTWAPSAVSLMKRVPRVARLHKDLPRILDFSGLE